MTRNSLNYPISRARYMAELVKLVEALLHMHGPLTTSAVQELANQEIIAGGIVGAAERVRERARRA